MYFSPQGKMMFNDIFEMYYHLFTEIGLAVNSSNYLYDQDNGSLLKFKDKYIKATVVPVEIYAGKNDILFEPARNYNLMVSILGYYIDKETNNPDCNFRFIAQFIEDEGGDSNKQRVVVKTDRGDIPSHFYFNIYLGYIETIFNLSGNFDVDLSNFDVIYI